jgi:hypothetical protein
MEEMVTGGNDVAAVAAATVMSRRLQEVHSGGAALDLRIRIEIPVDTSISAGRIDVGTRGCGGGFRRGGGVAEESFQDQEIFRRNGDTRQHPVPCLLRCRLHGELASDAGDIFAL